MKKNYFSIVLIFSILISLPKQILAQSDVSVWDGYAESWTKGDGTESNPYLIENARQLAYIAEMVNAGVTTYAGIYFKLVSDLNMNNIPWAPIGYDDICFFCGKVDGNNHLIDSIFISGSYEYKYEGLFGATGDGFYCKSLGVNVKVTSVGGQATCIGGIVGLINGANTVIVHCYSIGRLTSSVGNCGGIVGFNNGVDTRIISCYNVADISSHGYSGGIIGRNNRALNIYNSYNLGTILSSTSSSYSGGIVGKNNSEAMTIRDCYNTGDISAVYSFSGSSYSGGIVGYTDSYSTLLINCYNVGNLVQGLYRGGIVGDGSYNSSNSVVNCYYMEGCQDNRRVGTEKTEAQMKSPSFPVILNSDSVVYVADTLNINQGYPIFANEMYVVTKDAENIDYTSATLKGVYSGPADIKGFKYKKSTDSDYTIVYCGLKEPYNYHLSDLEVGTEYQYIYFVKKNGLVYYGEVKTFSTTACDLSVEIVKTGDAVCEGDALTLTAVAHSEQTSQFSYLWSTEESEGHISPIENGTYSVTVLAGNGCSQSATYTVNLYPVPEGVISGDTLLCEGNNVQLTASGAWSYLWNTKEKTATISVVEPGTYTCTFTNEYGCTSVKSINVSTFSEITISGDAYFCEGSSTRLTILETDSCLWSTGARTTSISVNQPGEYSVTMYHGSCAVSANVEVTMISLPTPIITGKTTFCEGETSMLVASGGVGYKWSTGALQNSISVDKGGTYTVTVTTAEGCSATTSTLVTVNLLPNVTIEGTTSFCQEDNTILTATGAQTYRWKDGSTDPSLEVTQPGTYRVTGTDANGCSQTASVEVSVNPIYNTPISKSICEGESYPFFDQNLSKDGVYTHRLKTVNGCDSVITLTLSVKHLPVVTVTGKTTFCEGETSMLVASGGVGYKWSTGSSQNSISVDKSGIYTVTVTSAEGCTASQEVPVTVNPLPNVTITGKQVVCEGNSTVLTANGADSYKWSTGDNTPQITVSEFGKYSVVGTDINGCSNEANVTVLVSPLPEIAILGETDICAGESTVLTATGGSTYLWSNGSSEESIEVSRAGTYQVIGYNDAGCEAKASVTVHIWQPTTSEFSVTTADSCYKWNDSTYCKSGDYVQTLKTVHGCDSVVTLHLTITVGIDGFTMNKALKIYPNPTSGIITIEGLEVNRIQLFDVYGNLLKNNVVNNGEHQIDISDCASGVYLIKAFNKVGVVGVKKIIKQ